MGKNSSFHSLLSKLNVLQRELLAKETGHTAVYFAAEAAAVVKAETTGLLRAVPPVDMKLLNGVNIGAGGRVIDHRILPVDLHRGWVPGLPEEQRTAAHLPCMGP